MEHSASLATILRKALGWMMLFDKLQSALSNPPPRHPELDPGPSCLDYAQRYNDAWCLPRSFDCAQDDVG